MSRAALLAGTELAGQIAADTASRAARFTEAAGALPCLATVLVGDDPASVTCVLMKQNRSRRAGISSRHTHLPAGITTGELVGAITRMSRDPAVQAA